MKLKVDAFGHGVSNKIPIKYTCDGEEISPGLAWDEVPELTKSFAVFMEDLDVPHRSNAVVLWLLYNIPGNVREIVTGKIPEGAQLGINDLGKAHYSGPCPRPGTDHQRYSVQLFALDTVLNLENGATFNEFFRTAKGHILTRVEAIGTYERYKK